MNKEKKQLTIKGDFQTSNVVLELEHGVHAKAQKMPTKKPWKEIYVILLHQWWLELEHKRGKNNKEKNKIEGKYCIHHSHLANFTKIYIFNKWGPTTQILIFHNFNNQD